MLTPSRNSERQPPAICATGVMVSEAEILHLGRKLGPFFVLLDRRRRVASASREVESLLGHEATKQLGKALHKMLPLEKAYLRKAVGLLVEEFDGSNDLVACDELTLPLMGRDHSVTLSLLGNPLNRREFPVAVALHLVAREAFPATVEEHMQSAVAYCSDALALAAPVASEPTRHEIVYVNRSFETVTGLSQQDVLGRDLTFLDSQDADPVVLHELRRALREKRETTLEYQVAGKGRKPRWAEVRQAPVFSEDGRLIYWLRVQRDITGQREVEERLLVERERLKAILGASDQAIIVTDAEDLVTHINREAVRLSGWRHNMVEGLPTEEVFPLVHEHDLSPMENPTARAFKTGETVRMAARALLVTQSMDTRPVAFTATPLFDGSSHVVGSVMVFNDLTDKSRKEKEMLRAQQLESVTALAGSIANELNNVMTSIAGNLSLASSCCDPSAKVQAILRSAERATVRARDLTVQLATYAKSGMPTKERAPMHQLLRESATFILRGTNCRCELSVPQDLWAVDIDTRQMNQVFNNLLLNAMEAMEGGGTIFIGAENLEYDGGGSVPISPGCYVRAKVRDEGAGIAPESLGKVFQPHYTTKTERTGLGLSSIRTIVKNHEGYIGVESEPGRGTEFTVYLPARLDDGGSEEEAMEDLDQEIVPGKGRVLIMDDEDLVQQVAKDLLEHLGYEVDTAETGDETLEKYRKAMETGKRFDIVLMDLSIPGGKGAKETIGPLIEMDPDAVAVLSSGYSNDPLAKSYEDHGFKACLMKPYNIQRFSQTLGKLNKS